MPTTLEACPTLPEPQAPAYILIREMTETDLTSSFFEALASLAEVGLSPGRARMIFRRRRRVGVRTYVALLSDKVVGTASLLVEPKYLHGGGRVGHVEDVAVSHSRQTRGVGTALMCHVNAEARRLGCYKIILNCFAAVAPFYEHLGYHQHDLGLRLDLS